MGARSQVKIGSLREGASARVRGFRTGGAQYARRHTPGSCRVGRGRLWLHLVIAPTDIQLIGNEVAIKWADGAETYITSPALRANSPSAAAKGEPDLFGRIHGAEGRRDFSTVTVTGWQVIGNYAVRFDFSDGHNSGLYSYELLRQLSEGAAS